MADSKISQLPAASAPTGAEELPVVQGGTTKRVTIAGLATAMSYNDLKDRPASAQAWTPVAATGTGSSQNITLPEAVNANDVLVFVNGLYQTPTTHYTVTGTTLSITAPASSNILVYRPGGLQGPPGENSEVVGNFVPDGGTTGQVLAKQSNTNGSTNWVNQSPNVSSWPVMVAELGNGDGTQTSQSIPGTTFQTINVVATTDTHGAWNSTNKWWTVPAGQSGVYEVAGKARLVDGFQAGVSIGLGMHSSSTDHPAFFWDNTKNNRQGIQNVRVSQFNAGDNIRLFIYIDASGSHNLAGASLTIQRIR